MTSTVDPAATASPPRRTATLVGIGTGHALEWYDWGIYAVFVPYFAGQFFAGGSQTSDVLASLAVFAVGFAARPLGGLVFGRIADRVGRRTALSATVSAIAIASFVIGVCPTYAQIGLAAPLVLVAARIVQGLACGGELPSAQTYLAEYAPGTRRGQWSSVIYIASVFGNTVGVALGFALTLVLSEDQMFSWGWRVPFLVGGVLGLVALYIRRNLNETASFESASAEQDAPTSPWRPIWDHRRQALQVIGLTAGLTVTYYAWVIAAPAYAITTYGVDKSAALAVTVAVSVGFMALMPFWGRLSDRIGRRPVLLISTLGGAAALIPAQALLSESAGHLALAMGLEMFFLAAGVSILPAVYAEMFPTRIRATGLAIPYSIAVALFGGTAPYLQTWLSSISQRTVFTIYMAALLLISSAVIAKMPETRAKSLD